MRLAIIGGGPAGIFAAIQAAREAKQMKRDVQVTVYETARTLRKVKISGGGRCNVTHACFDVRELVKAYPRGHKELLGVFHRFQPQDTIDWFNDEFVQLKTEADGRMFPVTDDSQSIIDALLFAAEDAGVKIVTNRAVKSISKRGQFQLQFSDEQVDCDRVLLATGSAKAGWQLAESLGHSIVEPIPSLFTFNTKNTRLRDLSGISFNDVRATVKLKKSKFEQTGPLLITHWGLSGPAILKLSAWAARELHECDYRFTVKINFMPELKLERAVEKLQKLKREHVKKQIGNMSIGLPQRYWLNLLDYLGIDSELIMHDLSKKQLHQLAENLVAADFLITGKSTFKEEFVTAGGVSRREIDFKTMQSKVCDGLFLAGEAIDIDAITGGYNFQNCWATGYIAGGSMVKE